MPSRRWPARQRTHLANRPTLKRDHMSDERRQVEEISKAFEQEFERFADLRLDGSTIEEAEALARDLNELKVRQTGKKSPIAGAMKLVGKVPADDRAAFGQVVQTAQQN